MKLTAVQKWSFCLLLFFAVVALNPALFWHDPQLVRDDRSLIRPLETLETPGEYFQKWRSGEILDRTPVRDLSYLINIFLQRITGHGFFHLTNLLLWIFIIKLTWSLAEILHATTSWSTLLILAMLAFHPSLLTSVFWISGRKHLLAVFFILLATQVYLKNESTEKPLWTSYLLCSLFYLLAVASHPLILLWPLWMLALSCARKLPLKNILLWNLPPLMLMLGGLYENYDYYQNLYVLTTHTPKILTSSESSLWIVILAISRSFYQLLLPTTLAASYSPGSWENMIGLPLLCFYVFFLIKRFHQSAYFYLAFFFFPLALVYTKMTAIFVSDTYLLIPGLVLGLTLLLRDRPKGRQWPLWAVCMILLWGKSFFWSRAWNHIDALWDYSYTQEKSLSVLVNYSELQLRRQRLPEALEAIIQVKELDPYYPPFALIFSQVVMASNFLPQQKRKLLLSSANQDSYIAYQLGILYGRENGEWEQAAGALIRALDTHTDLQRVMGTVMAELLYVCEQLRPRPHPEQQQDKCRHEVQRFEHHALFQSEQKKQFTKRWRELQQRP